MHEMRRLDLLSPVRTRFELIDFGKTEKGISGRDQRAIMKTTSSLLKLLYPDGCINDEQLEELLLISCELRQRVREQLHFITLGEYDRIKLGVKLVDLGKMIAPTLEDADRIQKIALPKESSIGEFIVTVNRERYCKENVLSGER